MLCRIEHRKGSCWLIFRSALEKLPHHYIAGGKPTTNNEACLSLMAYPQAEGTKARSHGLEAGLWNGEHSNNSSCVHKIWAIQILNLIRDDGSDDDDIDDDDDDDDDDGIGDAYEDDDKDNNCGADDAMMLTAKMMLTTMLMMMMMMMTMMMMVMIMMTPLCSDDGGDRDGDCVMITYTMRHPQINTQSIPYKLHIMPYDMQMAAQTPQPIKPMMRTRKIKAWTHAPLTLVRSTNL
jgi:hypothetical protein